MTIKNDLEKWIVEGLRAYDGRANIADICKHIWDNHELELRNSGKYFYTWQYDMRWAGQDLQKSGKLKKHTTFWELT